jgi:16S rRNA processing protein RimM
VSDLNGQDKWVLLGVITGVHGVRGHVRLKSFTENPSDIETYGPLKTSQGEFVDLHILHSQKDHLVAQISGVTTREKAEALKGVEFYAERARFSLLEEEEFYTTDLIGLLVQDQDGHPLGKVINVENYGAGDLVLVEEDNGKRWMVPFRKEFVPVINLQQQYLELDADLFASLKA